MTNLELINISFTNDLMRIDRDLSLQYISINWVIHLVHWSYLSNFHKSYDYDCQLIGISKRNQSQRSSILFLVWGKKCLPDSETYDFHINHIIQEIIRD